jgi:hypothetical protein
MGTLLVTMTALREKHLEEWVIVNLLNSRSIAVVVSLVYAEKWARTLIVPIVEGISEDLSTIEARNCPSL